MLRSIGKQYSAQMYNYSACSFFFRSSKVTYKKNDLGYTNTTKKRFLSTV